MNISMLRHNIFRTFSLISFVGLANLVTSHSANAFTVDFKNTDFENNFTNWGTTGDASIQGIFQGIDPIGGNNQALITTSCPDTAFAGGECFDTQNPTNPRFDDPNVSNSRTFNFSGFDQTDANGNNAPNNLQTFLGLGANSLNIDRTGGTIPGFRTPKEGSAITQTITVDKPFKLTFNWNYLTNDGTHPIFGNQDYSFLTLYSQNSDPSSRTIKILGDSIGAITTSIPSGQTDFEKVGGYISYDSGVLQPGTYVVGLGVVDTDGTGISSGLLIDNFAVEEVPFDFSASTGLGLVASIFGMTYLRRKFRDDKPLA
ncbi:MAG: PFE-CTERM domain-containing protein [Waterburya sp.]